MTNPNMVLYSHLFGNPAPLPKEYFPLMDRWWKIEPEDSGIFTTNNSFSLVVSDCCPMRTTCHQPQLPLTWPQYPRHPAPAAQLCQLSNNITKCWEQDAVYPHCILCIPHHHTTTPPHHNNGCASHIPSPLTNDVNSCLCAVVLSNLTLGV